MSHRGITVGAIIALALLAGGVSYVCCRHALSAAAVGQSDDSLGWVRHEFRLSGEKLAQVEAMHVAYQLVCAGHCLAIAEARDELTRLQGAHASPTEIEAAVAKAEAADAHCLASTEAHIQAVAALIGGDAGRHYLATVRPRVGMFDHPAPASLDLHSMPAHEHPAGN